MAYLDEDDKFLLKKDGAEGDPKAIEAEADPAASDKGPLRPRSNSGNPLQSNLSTSAQHYKTFFARNGVS